MTFASSSNSYCRMPWTHLQIEQDGSYRPCCRTSGFRKERNFDVNSYLGSKELQDLKSALLRNEKPVSCARCWSDEKHGAYSLRQIENQKYNTQEASTLDAKNNVITMEVRLGNVCNFSCRMCSTAYSSRWSAKLNELSKDTLQTHGLLQAAGVPSKAHKPNQDSLDSYVEFASQCDEIYISGGEPFLFPRFEDFLKNLRDRTGGRASVFISTNGSVYNKDVMHILGDFKYSNVSISIDGIKAVNDYVRVGSDWAATEKNLRLFKRHSNQTSFTISPTINIYNILYLPELLLYFEEQLHPEFNIKNKYNFQVYPAWQAFQAISPTLRKKISEKYDVEIKKLKLSESVQFLKAVENRLRETEFSSEALGNFISLNKVYDKINAQDMGIFLPELEDFCRQPV